MHKIIIIYLAPSLATPMKMMCLWIVHHIEHSPSKCFNPSFFLNKIKYFFTRNCVSPVRYHYIILTTIGKLIECVWRLCIQHVCNTYRYVASSIKQDWWVRKANFMAGTKGWCWSTYAVLKEWLIHCQIWCASLHETKAIQKNFSRNL